ncbi:MAG: RDD family protein [Gemmatimonadota bacterium]
MPPAKRIITPEHFKVAPGILGLPLASPSRRALAMAIDLILVALLVKAGGVLLGIAAAVLLFRASAPSQREGFVRQSVRFGLRLTGAIILFVVIVNAWGAMSDRAADLDEDDTPAATRVLAVGKESGATAAAIYEARAELIQLMGENGDSGDIRALDSAIAAIAGPPPATADETAARIQQLERESARYRAERDSLNRELDQAREARGLRTFIAAAADDLGLGFGWSAVFFTAFLALWRGQTPGKRFAGVRVLRLDGKPMGWWISFERFGGYAASFSVGLLGFFQILWDRNRQGLHDKACETVVVYDSLQVRSRS